MEIDYTIKRSAKRRKLTITVERDRRVVVHAPVATTDERIAEVIESKRQWLFEKTQHPQKYEEPHPPGKEIVSGEAALYLGRNYRIEIEDGRQPGVTFDRGFLVRGADAAGRRDALREWYIERAKRKILPRVERHAKELGVEYAAAKIVDNRYRWGSCTPKDNVNLNWRLIKAPMFVIDYVVVHELAHLIEPNHTDRFWNIVRTQAATAEKAKSWLRENGQLLEADV